MNARIVILFSLVLGLAGLLHAQELPETLPETPPETTPTEAPAPTDEADLSDYGSEFKKHVGLLRKVGLDVVFLFDSTSSMTTTLASAKAKIRDLNKAIGILVPSCRVGVYSYRDLGDEYVVRGVPLSLFKEDGVKLLNQTEADAGGDYPEGVDLALKEVTENAGWRQGAVKIIFLVGDAPSHDTRTVLKILEAANKGRTPFNAEAKETYGKTANPTIVVHCLQVPLTTDNKAGNEIGMKMTADEYKQIAQKTGGMFVPLEKASEVMVPMLTLVFGEKFKESIEKALSDIEAGRLVQPFNVSPMTPDEAATLLLGEPAYALPIIMALLDGKGDPDTLPIPRILEALKKRALEDTDQIVGLITLSVRHGKAAEAFPVLKGLLDHKSVIVGWTCLKHLAEMDGGKEVVLGALKSKTLAGVAASVIADNQWTDAVPLLVKLVKPRADSNTDVILAIKTLTGIKMVDGSPAEVKKIQAWIESQNPKK